LRIEQKCHDTQKSNPFKFTMVLLGLTLAMCSLPLVSCGSGTTGKLSIKQPEEKSFVKGWATIEIGVEPADAFERVSLAIRYLGEAKIYKQLKRTKPGEGSFQYDWDTTKEKDGPYQIEVEGLSGGQVVQKKLSPVFVSNRPAVLRFLECKEQPIIVRDSIKLKLEWVDAPKQLPDTLVELFVQGKSRGKKARPPYDFSVDLKDIPHGTEVHIAAVAVEGIYRGSTTVCSAHIDRSGPRLSFVYPSNKTVVPRKFSAVLQIEEDFGIQEARILVNGKIVGKQDKPPYQIPVDLSAHGHNAKVTLTALAIDRAGNQTSKPPKLDVVLDVLAPKVTILKPESDTAHTGEIQFRARVTDDAGVGRVDFYIANEKGEKLDNILHTTGKKNKTDLFESKVKAAVTLYGAGPRQFIVEAHDNNGNLTRLVRPFIIGCKTLKDCPTPKAPWRCLGNRCLIPHKLNDPCDHAFSCEPPLICFHGGTSWCSKVRVGICRAPCNNNACPSGQFCRKAPGGKLVCFPGDPCAPFTINCTIAQQCVPLDQDSFVCLPAGNLNENASCTPLSCSTAGQCKRGMACVPRDGGSGGFCAKLCDLDFAQRDCGERGKCKVYPLYGKGTNKMGYCL